MLLCVRVKSGKLEELIYIKETVGGCEYSWTRSGVLEVENERMKGRWWAL
jgi:hypothetical protein